MAWSTPRTWSPGETVTSNFLNTYLRDELNVLATSIDTATGKIQAVSSTYFDTLVPMVMVLNAQSPFSSPTNTSTGETTLFTYSLAAGYLANNGAALRMTSWGTTLNNGNTKTVAHYFGSSIYGWTGNLSINIAHCWMVQSTIVRMTGTTQTCFSQLESGANNAAGTNYSTTIASPGQTLSGGITMKNTATGGATGDITGLGFVIETLIQ